MPGLNFTVAERNAVAVDVGTVQQTMQLLQNIGDIGLGRDFSNNRLASPIQVGDKLVEWLLSTPISAMLQNAARNQSEVYQRSSTGKWTLVLPQLVYTQPPTDTTGLCCWTPFEIGNCGQLAELDLLCLKDCSPILDEFINKKRAAGDNDLIGYFQRKGETVWDARLRMNLLSMQFFTENNLINGLPGVGTQVLKPFRGLLSVLEDDAVISIAGMDILSAFEDLKCRFSVIGGLNSSFVVAVHPLTLDAIKSQVVVGKFNQLPDGWTKTGDTISYRGVRFIDSKKVPVDITAGVGEAWLLNDQAVGAYLGAGGLQPGAEYIREGYTSTNDPNSGCASDCIDYYNYGTVVDVDPNLLAVINNIPLNGNCLGNSLQGLDGLIQPDTLVPRLT